ncbi:hypothetical protein M9H77_20039 [Catharanthus roseus]|uniref:Uncharacterized protein n=1 Tax=Catharanthus roseus TaxID=4058 RepID=A0ACC0AJ16_CATRO|nr:hypothetical protein M9H77_20039 [Catharanthus roseus]
MAPKKSLPPPPPPPPESEEEEEETSEEESEGESEVEEKEQNKEKMIKIQPSQVNKKSSVQKQTTPPPLAPQSEEQEEESGSDEEEGEKSDSPPSPNASDFLVKAVTPTKLASKDGTTSSKRTSDVPKDEGKDLREKKRAKINEEQKKEKASVGAGRVWSEEDVIALLEGTIDYQKKNGVDPSADIAALHEFIKGKLHADMSKSQLYEKVRRLKQKFFANVKKVENGEDSVFSKPHESKTFDLSKKIWGTGSQSNDGGVDSVNPKVNAGKMKKGVKIGSISGIVKEEEKKDVAKGGRTSVTAKEVEKDDVDMDDLDDGDFQAKYPHFSQSFDLDGSSFYPDPVLSVLKENLSLIDSVKAREFDEKWKNLREQEAEFFLKRITLISEQTELILNAGKKR